MTISSPISVKAFSPSINSLSGKDVGSLAKASGHSHIEMAKVVSDFMDGLIKDLIPVEGKKAEISVAINDTADKIAQYSFAAKQNLVTTGEAAFSDSGEAHSQLHEGIYQLSFAAITHLNEQLLANGISTQVNIGESASQLQSKLIKELKKPPTPAAIQAADVQNAGATTETQTVNPETTPADSLPIDQLIDGIAEGIKNPANGMAKLVAIFNKDPVALLKSLAKFTLPAESEAIKAFQYLMADGGKNLNAIKSFIEDNLESKNFAQKLEQLTNTEPEKAAAVKVYLKHLEQHLGESGTINLTRGLTFSEANKEILKTGLIKLLPESIQTQIAGDSRLEDALSTVEGLQGNPAKSLELVRDFKDAITQAEKLEPRAKEMAKQKASTAFLEKVLTAAEQGELNTKDLSVISVAVLGKHEIKDKQDKDTLEQMKATLKEKFKVDIGDISQEKLLKAAGITLSAIVAVGMFFPGITNGLLGMAGGLAQMGGMALVGKLFGGEHGGGFADVLKFQAMNAIGDLGQGKSHE